LYHTAAADDAAAVELAASMGGVMVGRLIAFAITA
jgi:hypothetical protein